MSLSRGALRLFKLISEFLRKSGWFAPSRAWIAGHLKRNVRTVARWIAELIKGGLVAVVHRPNRSSVYRILSRPASPQMSFPYKEKESAMQIENPSGGREPSKRETEMPPSEWVLDFEARFRRFGFSVPFRGLGAKIERLWHWQSPVAWADFLIDRRDIVHRAATKREPVSYAMAAIRAELG